MWSVTSKWESSEFMCGTMLTSPPMQNRLRMDPSLMPPSSKQNPTDIGASGVDHDGVQRKTVAMHYLRGWG